MAEVNGGRIPETGEGARPTHVGGAGVSHDTTTPGPVLLYDGVCGFCNHSVQMILRHDRRGTMRFAALQSDYGRRAVERHPDLRGLDSVVLLEAQPGGAGERVRVRSDAALRVAEYLGGPWRVFLLARLAPTRLRDFLYDLFARHRYRLFGRHDSCLLPAPEVRSRFIDV